MYFVLILLCFIIILYYVETVKKKTDLSNELTRNIAHSLGGVITFFASFILGRLEIFALAVIFTIIFVVTRHFKLLQSIYKVNRYSFGEIFFPIGIGLSALLFLPHHIFAFQFGITILTFADLMANIIGRLYGKHKIQILDNNKSLEGSAAFFLTSIVIFLFFSYFTGTSYSLYASLLLAGILTLLELYSPLGVDNFVLPVVASYLFVVFS